MADELKREEYCLPCGFLEDELLMDGGHGRKSGDGSLAEGESEEDEVLAGLTWKLAQSMFLHKVNELDTLPAPELGKKERFMFCCPQSTLSTCAAHNRDQRASRKLSPPLMPGSSTDETFDQLYYQPGLAHAERLKRADETYNRLSTSTYFRQAPNSCNGYTPVHPYPAHESKYLEGRWPWVRQQGLDCSSYEKQSTSKSGRTRAGRHGLYPTAWPSLKQQKLHPQHGRRLQPDSGGMRAVFLGGSVTRKESSGTGVFLPRQVGNPSNSSKRPACSAVLVPARVVQALNLNVEEMVHVQPQMQYKDTSTAHALRPQRGSSRVQSHALTNQEVCLPPEWTY